MKESGNEKIHDERSVFNIIASHAFKALLPIPEALMQAVEIQNEMAYGPKPKASKSSLYNLGGLIIKHPTMSLIAVYTERKKNDKKRN